LEDPQAPTQRSISFLQGALCRSWIGAFGLTVLVAAGVLLLPGVAHAQVDCSATGTTGVPQIECEALMALYVSADGANWTDNSNWDTASAVDTWFGVTVSAGQVSGLSLFTNQLTGTIPSELGNLASLTDLRLYDNQLTAAIPPELGGLANLRTLYLHQNQLTGPIPLELGNLSNMTDLRMNTNQLTGPIPPELGNLSNLITLYLYSNQLSGSIPPELENLASLTSLYLYSNQLSGSIPPELGNLSNLTSLYLSANLLTGAIPPELSNLSNLVVLSAYGNQLSGSIPPELGSLSSLTSLNLGNNQLTGPIPRELGDLSNLVSFFAYGNQLSGSLPPELGSLTNLSTLYLVSNQLTGPIPPELGNLTSLSTAFLSNNQLSGSLPPELGNLSSLDTLYLHANQLTGSIPPELGNLSNLDTLYLYGNQLSGSIPPELGNLSNLTALQLSSNQLTGPIPPELGNLSSLTSMQLYGNQLTGSIPPELGNLANLTTMQLSNNQLSGSIPPELGNLSNLTTLQLSNNQLSGDIPDLTALPLTSLVFTGNAFVFADFEAEFADYNDGTPATFSYSSQASVDTARVEDFPVGASALLPSAVAFNPSGNDRYQWYKDGTPIAGPDGTARDLDVTIGAGTVSPAHAGDYHYTITNTVVTGVTLTSQVITVTVSATCGDGFVNDPSEVCDDGNLSTGDGCNAACLLEVGEPCASDADCASNRCNTVAAPPVCAPPVGCGNGLLEAGEGCDDGNNMNGDGCTTACEIEDGSPCATDGECASGVCDVNEAPPVCEPAGSCGNGALDIPEACDDGNTSAGDGCSAACLLEEGESCDDDAQCESTVCDAVDSNTCEPVNSCGNGALEGAEACDDGNALANDDCSAECLFELGAGPCNDDAQCESTICDTVDSNTCEPVNSCGNGKIEEAEVCDDGNTSEGDSCNSQCLLELGAGPCNDGSQCGSGVCNTMAATSVCAAPLSCGNGILDANEVCDDGNVDGGDGCSRFCTLENDWRGGGGCAVHWDSDRSSLRWLWSLLLLSLIRRRRLGRGRSKHTSRRREASFRLQAQPRT
jgi:cysteine-rich repeat protein